MMMKCGHESNSIYTKPGEENPVPSCVICVGTTPDALIPAPQQPDLTNRFMRCGYDNGEGCSKRGNQTSVRPSDRGAAFFEYRGPGSRYTSSEEYDSYYCGCYGWD